MIVDIGAHIRRWLVAGLPLVAGCGPERGAGAADAADPADDAGAADECAPRVVVALPPGKTTDRGVNLPFDPRDPRWADLYEACLASGEQCARLCSEILNAAAQPARTTVDECTLTCDGDRQRVAAIRGGSPSVPGRRPAGVTDAIAAGPGTSLGELCAAAAALEAASVPAFVTLARELRHHGAPADLVARARAAARDEEHHFRLMRRLAERHGSRPRRRRPRSSAEVRTLEAVALENAREGCVGETYAAVVAAWQAERAADPEVRAVMRQIAADEAAHAQLAWDVDGWAADRLGDAAGRVRDAREARGRELVLRAGADVDPALVAAAGLPAGAAGARLAAAVYLSLWA